MCECIYFCCSLSISLSLSLSVSVCLYLLLLYTLLSIYVETLNCYYFARIDCFCCALLCFAQLSSALPHYTYYTTNERTKQKKEIRIEIHAAFESVVFEICCFCALCCAVCVYLRVEHTLSVVNIN